MFWFFFEFVRNKNLKYIVEKKLELGSGPILVRRPYVWYPCCLKLIFFSLHFSCRSKYFRSSTTGEHYTIEVCTLFIYLNLS